MASEEADQQAAADVEARFLRCNKEQLTAELQRLCETQDHVIRDAWKKILDSLQLARDRQSRVVSVYNAGLSENTFRIVTAEISPEITLPSYRDIAAHFADSSPQPPLVDTTPVAPQALPSPRASPTLPRSQHLGQVSAEPVSDRPRPAPVERSDTLTADDETAPVLSNVRPQKRLARRGGASLSAARQPPNKRSRIDPEDGIATRTVDAKLVKGREYIFHFPSLDRGWHVLRCDLGRRENQGFLRFKSHPFESRSEINPSPATNHFRNRTCPGHEAKNYTDLQLVQNFGYRVVSEDTDEVVNQSWVDDSNRRLPSGSDYAGEVGITTSAASNPTSLARLQRA